MRVPPPTPHGFWLEEAGPLDPPPRPPLDGDRDADVVVVGGGYAGMWAAWNVLDREPDARVVQLEADLCGHGPSGRNGGFCNGLWYALPELRRRFGDERALAVVHAADRAVDAIGQFCEGERVDAWFRRTDHLIVSTAPAHDGIWDPSVRACAEVGEPTRVRALTAEEIHARCASPRFRAGCAFPAATVQPARLSLGLRGRLIRRGVTVHERTRVRRLTETNGANGAGGVLAETDGGRVRARSAVVAVGGAARSLAPVGHRLTVASSHMIVTEPVPDVIAELGWTGGEAITDGRTLLHYLRPTRDDRIAIGWAGGTLACGARMHGRIEVDPEVAAQVERDLLALFPMLEGRAITHAWGGPIDVSPTHLPLVTALGAGRAHAAFGFTGNGVGPSRLAGEILAGLALDRRDELTGLALVDPGEARVPPEPLSWLGGTAVRAALIRRERLEDAGRTPDALTRAVTEIPRMLGMQLGRGGSGRAPATARR